MRKRKREVGVANKDGTRGSPLDLCDTSSQPLEVCNQVNRQQVQSFLQTFHEKFRSPGFARLQAGDVVCCLELAIGPGHDDWLGGFWSSVWAHAGQPKWIIPGIIGIASWRQMNRCHDLVNRKPGTCR